MAKLLIMHGPNLNLLGNREAGVYGVESLASINENLKRLASTLGHTIEHCQSNSEGELIDRIHQAKLNECNAIIFNPAAYTHTSIALRDALLAVNIPFVEIHLSNTQAREHFRQHSYFSDIAVGVISGFGAYGYQLALLAMDNFLKGKAGKLDWAERQKPRTTIPMGK